MYYDVNMKMLACAILGGEESDLQKMIRVHNNKKYVDCIHGMEDNQLNVASIYLNKFAFGEEVGYAAKCPRCGKIYYSVKE